MTRFVYVVSTGENNQGGHVVSIHRTAVRAVNAALNTEPHFAGGWRNNGKWNWANGVDWLKVQRMKVQL